MKRPLETCPVTTPSSIWWTQSVWDPPACTSCRRRPRPPWRQAGPASSHAAALVQLYCTSNAALTSPRSSDHAYRAIRILWFHLTDPDQSRFIQLRSCRDIEIPARSISRCLLTASGRQDKIRSTNLLVPKTERNTQYSAVKTNCTRILYIPS